MKKNANKGFSLVELIIVIAIMAVLIGVLAPQFIKQVEKSRESTDLQNIEEIKTAVETAVAEEAITSDTVTITVDPSATNKKITYTDSTALAKYGIVAGGTSLKSTKWNSGSSFDITYSTSTYSWSYPATMPEATYFKADGTPKP